MSHTYTSLLVHVVFSTKDRKQFIDDVLEGRLHAYLGGIADGVKCKALAIGGMADHVHLLISYPPTLAVAVLLRELKANSSKWVHEEFGEKRSFAWQPGYAAFSVSRSVTDAIIEYIRNQKEHHRRRSFREELELLVEKHGGSLDELEW
ncbi:IS200/IS605 family transposase [Anatilimnocola sp. NA78]|uniref:IS200/IS605 family transposase n=1 Tax=Anatilimnocola sp. NA78 TaxID=3415683 RepID=UPI003CE4817D